jgi:hypothetical protein
LLQLCKQSVKNPGLQKGAREKPPAPLPLIFGFKSISSHRHCIHLIQLAQIQDLAPLMVHGTINGSWRAPS